MFNNVELKDLLLLVNNQINLIKFSSSNRKMKRKFCDKDFSQSLVILNSLKIKIENLLKGEN